MVVVLLEEIAIAAVRVPVERVKSRLRFHRGRFCLAGSCSGNGSWYSNLVKPAVCKMRILFCKILLIGGLYGLKEIVNGMTFSFLFSGPVCVRNSSDRFF